MKVYELMNRLGELPAGDEVRIGLPIDAKSGFKDINDVLKIETGIFYIEAVLGED